jgi:hypothetical protein
MKHEFRLILGIDDFTDPSADALFEAGFDDAHLTRRDGRACIVIDDRETTDLAAAVRGAVVDAQRKCLRPSDGGVFPVVVAR